MNCQICGKPLTRAKTKNVLVTALGKPLFGVHKGKCFEAYERTRNAGAQVITDLAKIRAPRAVKGFRMIAAALAAANEEL